MELLIEDEGAPERRVESAHILSPGKYLAILLGPDSLRHLVCAQATLLDESASLFSVVFKKNDADSHKSPRWQTKCFRESDPQRVNIEGALGSVRSAKDSSFGVRTQIK